MPRLFVCMSQEQQDEFIKSTVSRYVEKLLSIIPAWLLKLNLASSTDTELMLKHALGSAEYPWSQIACELDRDLQDTFDSQYPDKLSSDYASDLESSLQAFSAVRECIKDKLHAESYSIYRHLLAYKISQDLEQGTPKRKAWETLLELVEQYTQAKRVVTDKTEELRQVEAALVEAHQASAKRVMCLNKATEAHHWLVASKSKLENQHAERMRNIEQIEATMKPYYRLILISALAVVVSAAVVATVSLPAVVVAAVVGFSLCSFVASFMYSFSMRQSLGHDDDVHLRNFVPQHLARVGYVRMIDTFANTKIPDCKGALEAAVCHERDLQGQTRQVEQSLEVARTSRDAFFKQAEQAKKTIEASFSPACNMVK